MKGKTLSFLCCSLTIVACSESPKTEAEKITAEYLLEHPKKLQFEKTRCQQITLPEAMQDELCQLVNQVQRKKRMQGYTDMGEPAKVLDKLPGRP